MGCLRHQLGGGMCLASLQLFQKKLKACPNEMVNEARHLAIIVYRELLSCFHPSTYWHTVPVLADNKKCFGLRNFEMDGLIIYCHPLPLLRLGCMDVSKAFLRLPLLCLCCSALLWASDPSASSTSILYSSLPCTCAAAASCMHKEQIIELLPPQKSNPSNSCPTMHDTWRATRTWSSEHMYSTWLAPRRTYIIPSSNQHNNKH